MENGEGSARCFRRAWHANCTKDMNFEIQDKISVALILLVKEEKADKQTFKRIKSSTLDNKTAILIDASTVHLACDQLDDQIWLKTSLKLQHQNIPDCTGELNLLSGVARHFCGLEKFGK